MSTSELSEKALPFSLFLMNHLEKEFKDQNREVGYDQGRSEALPKWNKLSKKDREEYRLKAAQEKEKINSFFSALTNYDKQKRELALKIAREKKEAIKNYLQMHIADTKDWKKSTFILGSVNIFAQTKSEIYPAELALAKFNLRDGLQENLNIHFEMSNKLPTGAHHQALLLSAETHRIPIKSAQNEEEYHKLFKDISYAQAQKKVEKFLDKTKVIFSFTEPLNKYKDIECLGDVLEKMLNVDNISVGSTEQLLATLQTQNGQPHSDNLNIREKLMKNSWEDYAIGCAYHYEVDANKYCTLARVKRWAYQICKLILTSSEIKLDKHIPDPNKTKSEEVQFLVHELLPFNLDDILNDTPVSIEEEVVPKETRPIAVVKPFIETSDDSRFQSNLTAEQQTRSTFTTLRLEDIM